MKFAIPRGGYWSAETVPNKGYVMQYTIMTIGAGLGMV